MSLTQTQIDEVGQALNQAMTRGTISTAMRGQLWIDVNSKAGYLVGNAEMIAALKSVIALGAYISSLNAYLALLSVTSQAPPPVAQPPAPAPAGGTMAPLSASDIATVIAECERGVAALSWIAVRTRVKQELSRNPPTYSYGDADIIEAVKELFYPPFGTGSVVPLKLYLNIIDQRDPANTNNTLVPGDPRWKYVSGAPAPVPNPAPAPTPVPAAGGPTGEILPGIFRNEYGQIGIGGMPLLDPRNGKPFIGIGLFLHNLAPSAGAGIAYVVTTPGTDPQRPGENLKRVGVDGVSLDGGRRMGANALYGSGIPEAYVPDGARPVWTFGADSKLDNDSFNCEKVEPDPNRPGFNRMVPTVVNGVRVTAGQRVVLYLMGREDLDGGKEQIILASMQDGEEISVRKSVGAHNAVNVPV